MLSAAAIAMPVLVALGTPAHAGPAPKPAPKPPAPAPAPATAPTTTAPAPTTAATTTAPAPTMTTTAPAPAMTTTAPAPTMTTNPGIIPCMTRDTAMPFSPWGDYRNYYLLQSGNFENGYYGWNLYGQSGLGWGNSPWGVWGGGQRSLWLGPGGTAVAPSFCADITEPWVRFFYLAGPEQNARLKVTLTVWRGSATTSQTYWLPGGSGRWEVGPPLPIPDVYGDGYRTLSVKFEAVESSTAQWLIDDMSVDPWKSLR